ncbi:MAG: UDP-galactopyranose mutase [Candidatus Eremiobacteraeota bacterium]|jgi:glycosyltransferase involved in cell wall biosynthesis|nr:UDP-galactopyranose mutase [Candidatus Eremiobacteraeota bacterium]
MELPKAFVAGLHLRWDGVRQRPQHLLSRLARRVPVVVIEEPFAARTDRDEVFADGAVTVIRPLRRRGWSLPLVDGDAIGTARGIVGEGPIGVWLYTPMMLRLAEQFAAAPLVYDVMDELAQFDFAPAGMAENDRAALARADLVFTGGRSLYAKRAALGAKVRCEPSGVELQRFAADTSPHPLTGALRGPVFGYVGVIDERIDVALIAALADAFPQGHVVLVGPVFKLDPARLPHRPNVHLTGAVAYDGLPSWLAGFDVALMPFARNRATELISPTKTLEYFAAGVPVVSTGIADVAAEFADAVYLADGPAAFVAAARAALAAPPERIARGVAHARERTWDAIAERMLRAVEAL